MVVDKKEQNSQQEKLHADISECSVNIVILGRPGSGKSTIFNTLVDELIFVHDEFLPDVSNKQIITEGIDYGEYQLDSKTKIKLYSTPGQKRYNELHEEAMLKADIYFILIDLTSVAPFAEFMYLNQIINTAGNEDALMAVVFTHFDNAEHSMSQLSKEIRRKCSGEILTVKIDARCEDQVKFIFSNAIKLKLSNIPPHQYYADNNLFLKNLN